MSIVQMLMGATYSPEAEAYFAAMTVQPDSTRKRLIDQLIIGLKSDGVWSRIDWLLLFAAHDAQAGRLNTKKPSKSCADVGTLTFTTDRGFAGDGSSSYQTLEAFNASGNIFTTNSAHMLSYNNNGTGSAHHIGGGTDLVNRIQANDMGSQDAWRINSTLSETGASTGKLGSRIISRTSSTDSAKYKDGALEATGTASSTNSGLSTVCTAHKYGNINFSADTIACVGFGGSLSATDAANYYNRLLTFLTAIGAN